jgi:hypothetical protein
VCACPADGIAERQAVDYTDPAWKRAQAMGVFRELAPDGVLDMR